ncbi:MAG: (2Fe-2S)-binding protein [Azospirillaceae bacterium]
MYICICNALNERTITDLIRDGAQTPDQVYRAAGVTPRCRLCAEEIEDLIEDLVGDHAEDGIVVPFRTANCA